MSDMSEDDHVDPYGYASETLRTKLFWTLVSISWFMCLLQIIGIFLFKRHYEWLIIQKRYPRLVMVEAVMSCQSSFAYFFSISPYCLMTYRLS